MLSAPAPAHPQPIALRFVHRGGTPGLGCPSPSRCACAAGRDPLRHGELPATPLNLGLPEPARIRAVAEAFGHAFDRAPVFVGSEQPSAWHYDCGQAVRLFGPPTVDLATMIRWNASWLKSDLPVYEKPTHDDQREGRF